MTADRGDGEQKVEDALRDLGVRTVVLPRKGRPCRDIEEATTRVQETGEVTHRLRRTDQRPATSDSDAHAKTDIDGARTWCGHGIFAHNLVKIATLTIPKRTQVRTLGRFRGTAQPR